MNMFRNSNMAKEGSRAIYRKSKQIDNLNFI